MPEKLREPELGDLTAEINRALQRIDVAKACTGIGSAIKLHNASEIARKAGIERPSVYRSFGPSGSPNFTTVVRVLNAMGLQIRVTRGRKRSSSKSDKTPTKQAHGKLSNVKEGVAVASR